MLKKYLIVCPLKENVCFINLKLFAIAFFVQVYAKTFVKQLKNDDSCPTLLLKTTIYIILKFIIQKCFTNGAFYVVYTTPTHHL